MTYGMQGSTMPQPGAGLAGMRSANLTAPGMQAAARAPGVATQAQPTPSAVSQAVPPQMQQMQAQLAGLAQQQTQLAPQMMQQILSMMGPQSGMPQASLGALMQPMGQAPQPGAMAAPSPNLTPLQQAAVAIGR